MMMSNTRQLTAPELLEKKFLRDYPDLDGYMAFMLANKSAAPWPDWCFLPMSVSYALLTDAEDEQFARQYMKALGVRYLLGLSALMPWRMDKVIYRFDESVKPEEDFVWTNQPIPHHCVYIANPPGVDGCEGVFFFMEWDRNYSRLANLRAHYLFSDGTIKPVDRWYPLSPVPKSRDSMEGESLDVMRYNQCRAGFPKHLKLLQHICSGKAVLKREAPEPKKKGKQLAVAARVDIIDVVG